MTEILLLQPKLLQALNELQSGHDSAQSRARYDELTNLIANCAIIMETVAARMQSLNNQDNGSDPVQFLLANPDAFEELQAKLKTVHSKLVLSAGCRQGTGHL